MHFKNRISSRFFKNSIKNGCKSHLIKSAVCISAMCAILNANEANNLNSQISLKSSPSLDSKEILKFNESIKLAQNDATLQGNIQGASESASSENSSLKMQGAFFPNMSDSNTQDIDIRKNKTGVIIGIGLNHSNIFKSIQVSEFSPSFLLGYSYFANNNFGTRFYASMDTADKYAYYAGNLDFIYDIIQGRIIGIGAIAGISVGNLEVYSTNSGNLVGQAKIGVSISFDSGKNRLELLAKYLFTPNAGRINLKPTSLGYVLMYSYTF